jgi:ribonuclease HI
MALRKAQLGIPIEIRWCHVHKGVPGNEKIEKWVKLVAERPEARSVE